MVNWQDGKAIDAIMNEISEPILFEDKEYFYKVTRAILNAADYGVPQNRERVFIVGNRVNKVFEFPEPTHSSFGTETLSLFGQKKLKTKTVWDAIGNLPEADLPSDAAVRVSESIKGRIAKHGY
jgi:DNA (cytosine-5)-methyltransferase 1